MKYLCFILAAMAGAKGVNSNALEMLKIRDRVATDRFRIFAEDEPVLPHNVQPYGNIKFIKKDTIETYSSDDEDETDEIESPLDSQKSEKADSLSELCKENDHFIESSSDMYHLQAQCDTILGNIHFREYSDALVDFGKLKKIQGSVFIENCSNIVKIEGHKLEKIGQIFMLRSLTSLVSIDLSNLREATIVDWKVLPILNEALLSNDLGGLKSLTISDTSLPVIEGFKNVEDVDIFEINNNRFLESVKANIKYVRQKLSVHANARETELQMPKLLSAENITVRDTSSVDFPRLEEVGSSLEFIQNHFAELRLSSLKTIGGTLGIIDNTNLRLADFNNVTDIQGGLMIANNTKLEKIDFFSNLRQIGGAIYFEGKFSDTDFPQLKLVKGSALIKTNSGKMDCSKWTTPKNGRSIVRGGKISCMSGRKLKAQSVSQDGAVLSESEFEQDSPTVHGSDSTGRESHSNKSQSSSANQRKPNSMLIMAAVLTGVLGYYFS